MAYGVAGMMRKAIITAMVAGVAYVASLAIPLSAGSSVRVIDGDTIELNGEKVRIANIDTPDTGRAKCETTGSEHRLRRRALLVGIEELVRQQAGHVCFHRV